MNAMIKFSCSDDNSNENKIIGKNRVHSDARNTEGYIFKSR